MGKFMISRHDSKGGWLLDGWLFVDMHLRTPVKRLSCGFVVVNLCQTSFPRKGSCNGVDNEHFQNKKIAFDPIICLHGSNGMSKYAKEEG